MNDNRQAGQVIITDGIYSENIIIYKNNRVVFGDNEARYGMGGQAIVRNHIRSIGIATKFLPTNDPEAFFSDEGELFNKGLNLFKSDVKKVSLLLDDGNDIIFPVGGLGTGLSQVPELAPKLFVHMNKVLKSNFGIEHIWSGTEYRLTKCGESIEI